MKAVIQDELTGCAIASAAAIKGISYRQAKLIANSIGIHADKTELWSSTQPIRQLLAELGVKTGQQEIPFNSWGDLPGCALVSLKWHLENNQPFWHWAVFVREAERCYVLDSKKSLKQHVRTDFGRMKPKWYIEIYR